MTDQEHADLSQAVQTMVLLALKYDPDEVVCCCEQEAILLEWHVPWAEICATFVEEYRDA